MDTPSPLCQMWRHVIELEYLPPLLHYSREAKRSKDSSHCTRPMCFSWAYKLFRKWSPMFLSFQLQFAFFYLTQAPPRSTLYIKRNVRINSSVIIFNQLSTLEFGIWSFKLRFDADWLCGLQREWLWVKSKKSLNFKEGWHFRTLSTFCLISLQEIEIQDTDVFRRPALIRTETACRIIAVHLYLALWRVQKVKLCQKSIPQHNRTRHGLYFGSYVSCRAFRFVIVNTNFYFSPWHHAVLNDQLHTHVTVYSLTLPYRCAGVFLSSIRVWRQR